MTYEIIHGKAKLIKNESTTTTKHTDGTEIESTSSQHTAYDENGKVLPTSSVTSTEGEFFDADGNLITDENGNGSVLDEVLHILKINGDSYVSETALNTSDGNVTLLNTVSGFELKWGKLKTAWSLTISDQVPQQGDQPKTVDPQITGKIVGILQVTSEAGRNRWDGGQFCNEATWIFIEDGDGNLWAVKYYTKFFDVEYDGDNYVDVTERQSIEQLGYGIGDTITLNGLTMANGSGVQQHFIIEATSITLDDGTQYTGVTHHNVSYSQLHLYY